jgi:hypothetical protein
MDAARLMVTRVAVALRWAGAGVAKGAAGAEDTESCAGSAADTGDCGTVPWESAPRRAGTSQL